MKVLQQTSTNLVILHRPILSWLFCGLFALGGLTTLFIPVFSMEEIFIERLLSWLGIGFATVFFWVSDSTKIVVWNFDKSCGTLTSEHRGLFSARTSVCLLEDIYRVQLDTKLDEGFFGIKLLLTDSSYMQLCSDYSISEDLAEAGIACISAFLSIQN